MLWSLLVLVFGIIACSTSAIFIRLSQIPPITLAAYRLLGAAAFLLPSFVKAWHTQRPAMTRRELFLPPVWSGAMLALHFITWITAARLTPVANASFIINLSPLVMPMLLYLFLHEKINRSEALSTAVVLIGLVVLGYSDYKINPTYFKGDLLCFVSMLFLSIYLVLGRKNLAKINLWLYMVPVYFYGFCFCFLFALGFENPIVNYGAREIGLALAIALIPTVIGHTVLNYAMRRLRGQLVSILSMFQFVFAGIFSYYIFQEVPSTTFYVVSFMLTLSAVLVTVGAARRERSSPIGSSHQETNTLKTGV